MKLDAIATEPAVHTPPPGPKSRAALAELEAVIGRGNYMGLYGIFLAGTTGNFVSDLDGNRYLDCLTGAATNNLGYNFEQVADAYHCVAKQIPHSSFSYSPSCHALELAKKLIELTPGDFRKKVLLGLCGSKSNEDALEIAWRATGKRRILRFHGTYLGATWLTKKASGFGNGLDLLFSESPFVALPFPCSQDDGPRVLDLIEKELKQQNIAAAIIEPILSDGGTLVPPAGFYQQLEEMLHRHQALLIVDESQTGMGRTGPWWGSETEQLTPDLLVIGKSLAAGYAPISALVGREELIEVLEQGQQIGTFIGHPPSAAAALEVIACIEKYDLRENIRRQGERLLQGLRLLVERFPDLMLDARGRGGLLGVEINLRNNPAACKQVAMRCLEKGLYLGYYGAYQEVLRIAPPMTIKQSEVDLALAVLAEVGEEMRTGSLPTKTRDKVKRFAIGLPMPKTAYCLTKNRSGDT